MSFKRFFAGIALAATIVITLGLAACGNTEKGDDEPNKAYGSLIVRDIDGLIIGESKTIGTRFTVNAYKSEITYLFEGNDISIKDGIVTALVAEKTVVVTAKTEYHETTFKVSTLPPVGWARVTLINDLGSSDELLNATITFTDRSNADQTYTLPVVLDKNRGYWTVRGNLMPGHYDLKLSLEGYTCTSAGYDENNQPTTQLWIDETAGQLWGITFTAE